MIGVEQVYDDVLTNLHKFILTPRVPHVPFRDDASLTAFFAHSRYSEFLDQKWLLSLNSIY